MGVMTWRLMGATIRTPAYDPQCLEGTGARFEITDGYGDGTRASWNRRDIQLQGGWMIARYIWSRVVSMRCSARGQETSDIQRTLCCRYRLLVSDAGPSLSLRQIGRQTRNNECLSLLGPRSCVHPISPSQVAGPHD
jgi:hypothetical protein